MPKRNISLTISIPAHNESANIQQLIESVLSQSKKNYVLDEIIIVDDGSTDETVKLASKFGKKITILSNATAKGKSQVIKDLLKIVQSDCLVLIDADVRLMDSMVIDNLVSPIALNDASLTSGNPIMVQSEGIFSKAMEASLFIQNYIKVNHGSGSSIYGCHGRLLALSKSLQSSVNGPISPIGNDACLYIYNSINNGTFKFVESAKVLFKMPTNFNDYYLQSKRFARSKQAQHTNFKMNVDHFYKISKYTKLMAILHSATSNLVGTLYFIFINIRMKFSNTATNNNQKWTISKSTKDLDG